MRAEVAVRPGLSAHRLVGHPQEGVYGASIVRVTRDAEAYGEARFGPTAGLARLTRAADAVDGLPDATA